jgi:hypothetical protein
VRHNWISNAHQFDAERFLMTMNGAPVVDTAATRLAVLREAKAKREEARVKAAEAQELAELELEEKLIADGKGDRGVDFEIISTEAGLFAVRKPDFLVAKKFNAIPAEKVTEEDVIGFVTPCILSDLTAFRMAITDHAGIASRLAIALRLMYEARRVDQLGKL